MVKLFIFQKIFFMLNNIEDWNQPFPTDFLRYNIIR